MSRWKDYIPHRWSVAERHCVLLCRDAEVARKVIETCAERGIALEWFKEADDVDIDHNFFHLIFVASREASYWEEVLRRNVYGRGASIINWF